MLSGAAQRWRANYLGMFFVGTHRGVQELGEGKYVRGCLARACLICRSMAPSSDKKATQKLAKSHAAVEVKPPIHHPISVRRRPDPRGSRCCGYPQTTNSPRRKGQAAFRLSVRDRSSLAQYRLLAPRLTTGFPNASSRHEILPRPS